jgi:hypothetical protein
MSRPPHSPEEPEIASASPDENPDGVAVQVEPTEEQFPEAMEEQYPEAIEEQCPEAMEYVNQLIARMGGSASGAGLAEAPSKPAAKTGLTLAAQPPATATAEPVSTTAAEQPKAVPTRRRPRPADMTPDLTRLREAANLTVTSDLKAHEFRSSVVKAYSDLIMAIVPMATSLVLVSLSDQLFSVAYGCAVLTLVQATLATRRFFRTTEVLNRHSDDGLEVAAPTA